MRLAHEPARRLVEIHDASGRALNSHFMLDGAAQNAVAHSRLALCVRQELRHEEKRDAFYAAGRIGELRQDKVNDVAG